MDHSGYIAVAAADRARSQREEIHGVDLGRRLGGPRPTVGCPDNDSGGISPIGYPKVAETG